MDEMETFDWMIFWNIVFALGTLNINGISIAFELGETVGICIFVGIILIDIYTCYITNEKVLKKSTKKNEVRGVV